MAIGPVISAKIGEKIGRAKQMCIGGILMLIINLLITFNTFGGAWGYAVARMFGVVIAMILALPAMVYPTEVLTQKYRSICGLLVVSTALGAGILLVVLFAAFFREWRQLQLIVSFITIPSIAAPWIMPESYRWLYSQVSSVLNSSKSNVELSRTELKKQRSLSGFFRSGAVVKSTKKFSSRFARKCLSLLNQTVGQSHTGSGWDRTFEWRCSASSKKAAVYCQNS